MMAPSDGDAPHTPDSHLHAVDDSRRADRRVDAQVRVRLWLNTRIHDAAAMTANLSLGGMFVATHHPLPVGCIARFDLWLPGEEVIEGLAEVTWIRPHYDGPDRPNGMGVAFLPLADEPQDRLRRFLLSELGAAGRATVELRERQL